MAHEREYAATDGVLQLLFSLNNGASLGTGVYALGKYGRNLIGHDIPPVLLARAISDQNNLFGNYPDESDKVPSIIFSSRTLVLYLLRVEFHSSYESNRVCTRAVWTKDILWVPGGLAGEVFLMVSSIFLITMNLILAQRIFTWRHPVGGNRRLFRYFMYLVYSLMVIIITGSVLSSAVPYLYFMSEYSHFGYKVSISVSAGFIILYSLMAIALVGLAFFFKPTRKDENLYTYQPWWIESFHPFYFVKKNAAREAEETFMKRNHNHRHAVRVIAATHHHYNMVEGLTNQRGDLKHNKSIMIVTLTTLLSLVESILRGIACYTYEPAWYDNVVCRPIVAYMCWGVLEVLIHVLYLVGRVDLRFYKPDVLPKKVRSIITAEQSIEASPDPTDLEYSDEEMEYFTDDEYEQEQRNQIQDHKEKYDSDPSSSFTNKRQSPPHYSSDSLEIPKRLSKNLDDAQSEFHF